jgi:hypothetical protein
VAVNQTITILETPPPPKVLYVPLDAPGIQAGINSASKWVVDTVHVESGDYYEYGIQMRSGVVLRGDTTCLGSSRIDAGGQGRAISCIGVDSTSSIIAMTIKNGTFTRSDSAWGGGMYMESSSVRVSHCSFESNAAYGLFSSGGAIAMGGGVYMVDSDPEFSHCKFVDNEVTAAPYPGENGFAYGAALYCLNSTPEFVNCTIANNTGDVAGMGWQYGSGIYSVNSAVLMEKSIMALNSGGYAIECISGGTATLSCSDVYGNSGDWVGCIAGQDGGTSNNFSADPEFCEPDSGNYRLEETSPCAEANSPAVCGHIGALPAGCEIPHAGVDPEAGNPSRFSLSTAIPNPFSPETEIRYSIPHGMASRVKLKVYDATGRLVTTLVDEDQGPGRYIAVWDGRDRDGVDTASGVYFYRITWKGRSETKRMVYLK